MGCLLSVAIALGIVTACGGRAPASPSPATSPPPVTSVASSPPETTSTPTPSATASPTPEPQVQLPSDAPSKFKDSVPADQVPLADIAPPGAQVTDRLATSSSSSAIEVIEFTWTRGSDPFAAEHGFEIWQRFAETPGWRVVYAFTDTPDSGVLGVRFDTGDLTNDGIDDMLTFEDTGGSGACGIWRVVEVGAGFAAEIYDKQTCDTQIEIGAGTLQVTEAVFLPGDAHCCPSKTRLTILRWNGQGWEVVSRRVTPNG